MLVYLETNSLENNKPYVGKLVDESKFHRYWGSGTHIKRAVKKHGKENFKKVILESGITDHDLLCKREKYWIKFYNSKAPNGYNLTDGGEGLINPSKETVKKISNTLKGNIPWNKGKQGIYSKETIERIRIGNSITHKGMPVWNKGKKHSTESIEKMRLVKLGDKNSFYGKHHTKEAREKMRKAKVGFVPWNKGKKGN